MQLVKTQALAEAPRSEAREALASAINTAAEASSAAQRGREAVARAVELVAEAEAKVAAAGEAVVAAREQQSRRVAEAITAGQGAPPGALRAARAAETDAADDLAAAQAALEQLEGDASETEAAAARANFAVERKINDLLVAEALEPLLERLKGLKVQISPLQAALHFIRMRAMHRRGTSTFADAIRGLELPDEVAKKISDAVELGGLPFNALTSEQHPVATAWREACAALRCDPDVDLPVF
jgi:hypothetical protein